MATLGSSKNNVMAVVTEVTEGTVVDPSAGTDFVTLQPDATLTPSFQLLQNDELRASIGKAKGIQGLEEPEMSFSHYLKHSAVEGQAPELAALLEAGFGVKNVAGTERSTTSSSTTTLLKLGAGGTDFARGRAVLVKDGTNGYAIRPVDSVATNDLTLGFPLANAPASGIACGKCVNFSPANSGHKSLSVHMFRGNGQAKELIAGAKVTEIGINAQAGELIKANFKAVGSKYFFNPIRIDSTNNKIDFYNGTTDYHATIPSDVYRTPEDLAAAIQSAMQTAAGSSAYTCTYDYLTGKFTFTKASGTFTIKWNTGTSTATTVATTIGFSAAADSSGGLTYTSASALTYDAGISPSYDAADPLVAKYQEILLGDGTVAQIFEAATVQFTLSNTRSLVKSIAAQSGVNSNLITAREAKVKVTALLDKHDSDKFYQFSQNAGLKFCYNFGPKVGGNWVAGKSGCLYLPTCTITSFELTDLDSVIGLSMELTSYVDSNGNGEVYLNFL